MDEDKIKVYYVLDLETNEKELIRKCLKTVLVVKRILTNPNECNFIEITDIQLQITESDIFIRGFKNLDKLKKLVQITQSTNNFLIFYISKGLFVKNHSLLDTILILKSNSFDNTCYCNLNVEKLNVKTHLSKEQKLEGIRIFNLGLNKVFDKNTEKIDYSSLITLP